MINLRSETVTLLTEAVGGTMVEAAVGEDVFGAAPRLDQLEE